jgi:hypothetical protein
MLPKIGGQGKLTCYMYFPWPPLKAALSISMFCFLLKHGRKLLFLTHMLLVIRSSPKEMTQHIALVSTVCNFQLD